MNAKFIDGLVPLTKELLELIRMVQSYKEFMLNKSIFEQSHFGKASFNWYKETQNYYESLNSDILVKYRLFKNNDSFEKIISFKVPEEMRSCMFEELPIKFYF
ncbi:hypothetical protein [Brevibacillus laterosporus]|uniref:hypothetical protein n=1 Tax=Brevibacillus laterosporus TaxID=1465 RepID=UPI0018F8B24A|nr:hypothetical protein [Brevibacillus laterosporus]MBG9776171.1 hypothetical protein [Brevibacillus laterosporus]MED1665746.1 hypothetical protein [Brevibacillus laterosporus]MED1667165.1 hypothetical protein [Brevibacillus laterosporus]MED1719767.1 hypothetical protein [Brevibacillus laterosporus]